MGSKEIYNMGHLSIKDEACFSEGCLSKEKNQGPETFWVLILSCLTLLDSKLKANFTYSHWLLPLCGS